MPELPEVHTTATILDKLAKNLRIVDVWTDYQNKNHKNDDIKNPKFFKKFKKYIVGGKIIRIKRRAKNVLLELDNGYTILVHMKMTGHLLYGAYKRKFLISNVKFLNKSKILNLKSKKLKTLSLCEIWQSQKSSKLSEWEPIKPEALKDPYNRFVHFVISLSNGKHIALSDMRKFAKITAIKTSEIEKTKHLKNIGPEPLSNFSFEDFKKRLFTKPLGKIKSVLMDQSVIAGIGNIYSDEILWASDVHPESRVDKIPPKILRKIFGGMTFLLKKGILLGGDSMSDYRNPFGEKGKFQLYHKAYRRKGEKCLKPDCCGIIERKMVGGRSAHFCPVHQIKY